MQDEQGRSYENEVEGTAQGDAPAFVEGETNATQSFAAVADGAGVDGCVRGVDAADGDFAAPGADASVGIASDDLAAPARPSKGVSRRSVAVCAVVAILFFFAGVFAANNGLQLFNDSPREYAEGEEAPATEVAMRLYKVAQALDLNGIYAIDLDYATRGTIEALLASTGDAHAEYFTEDAYKSYLQYTSGSYSGIGVVIGQCGKYTVVTAVYDDTPAAKAGVQVGDAVVSVDGVSQDWTPSSFTQALKREDGQSVSVVWLRPTSDSLTELGEAMAADREASQSNSQSSASASANQVALVGDEVQTNMEYGPITIPNIEYEMKGDVGYMRLSSFNLESGDAVSEAVRQLEEQGAKSLVLDLRDNGGGYVSQASKIVAAFAGDGVLMQVQSLRFTSEERSTGEQVTDLPLVVLVNHNSASASEIVASSLKDRGRATVVGTTTYGKGTVQDMIPLSFGGAIKYTVAEYLGVNGESIDGVGVSPDIEVEQTESSAAEAIGASAGYSSDGTDAQLDRALQAAQELE